MAILDSKGRLFGKLSLLDLGAALVLVCVVIGIFFFPGTSGSIAQVKATQPVEVDVLVRGLNTADPEELVSELQTSDKLSVVVRNQPSGAVDVVEVKLFKPEILITQPDGTFKVFPETRPVESMSIDLMITLAGDAQITDGAAVLENSQVKLGTGIELDGSTFNFKGSVVGVRLLEG